MRTLIIVILSSLFLISCKKDSFTSVPQITYLSISPNSWSSDNHSINGPVLTFQLTDLEGDFGFQDTLISYVYIKNAADSLNSPDSIPFPQINISDKRNLNAQVAVDFGAVLPPPHNTRPYTDTLYFEVYVKDFANHKSNVIKSTDPFYFYTP
ncbi:MAG: hypothetical protein WCH52_08950 [Bacteroidota bacterium]